MDQLYLIEIFINKVNLACNFKTKIQENEHLSVNVDFGKYPSFVIKQNEFDTKKDYNKIEDNDYSEEIVKTVFDIESKDSISNELSYTFINAVTLPNEPILTRNERSVSFQINDSNINTMEEYVVSEELIQTNKQEESDKSSEENKNLEEKINGKNLSGMSSMFNFENTHRRFSKNIVKCTKIFNAGASLLFSSHSENLVQTFKLFPLELSVWSDSDFEKNSCIGITQFIWDKEFYALITNKTLNSQNTVTLKEKLSLRSEYTSSIVGDMILYVRLSSLGQVVLTKFKQIPDDSDNEAILMRSNKTNNLFKCETFGKNSDLKNILSIGSLCDTLTIEDPEITRAKIRRKSINEELRQAGLSEDGVLFVIGDHKRYNNVVIETCGESFPCGNPGCRLTELVKMYLMEQESKESDETLTELTDTKQNDTQCCNCKTKENDDVSLEDSIKSTQSKLSKVYICEGCGGISFSGKTCNILEKNEADDNSASVKDLNLNMEAEVEKTEDVRENDDKFKDPEIQKCLYAGIAKMLANLKNGTHKKYCSEFKHKTTCPKNE